METPAHQSIAVWGAWTAALVPVLMTAPFLLPSSWLDQSPERSRCFARWGAGLGLAGFFLALTAASFRIGAGPSTLHLGSFGPAGLTLLWDTLSALMFVLVAGLGAVVTRYALTYLDGDPRRGHFTKWLCITLGCVLALILSGNLLLFFLAWTATSMSLHQLLVFYRDRPAATLAARKKFIISRLGDLSLLGVLLLTYQCFGSWDFQTIFSRAAELRTAGAAATDGCILWISLLLVLGALLKSAQFPFHSWLPDTMETPTPVSALMHAGIINAGGFLIIRFSPVVVLSPAALDLLALAGAFTALFASVVMLTQTSIKRALAYSTIAQMGFMMLQCGLGAFALALLHILAHSLYKAHAFLSSGSIVSLARQSWVPSGGAAAHPLVLVGALAISALITLALAPQFMAGHTDLPGMFLLGTILTLALAVYLWNLWAHARSATVRLGGALIAGMVALACFALHSGFAHLLESSLPPYHPERTFLEYLVMAVVLALFITVFLLQARMADWSRHPWWRFLYVHALNGFYLGLILNRLMTRQQQPRTTTAGP